MNNAMGKENERQIPFQMFQMLDFAYNWVANYQYQYQSDIRIQKIAYA